MTTNDLLGMAPRKRIKSFDGMAVTGDVWDEAHDYHRQTLAIHTAFSHGAGIVMGLEVVAGDPPDRQVYVQPGIAIDQLGRTIIMAEARAYDLRSIDGPIYLLLTHVESTPRADGDRTHEDAPRYIFTEYTLEAAIQLPETPHVELARLRRQTSSSVIRNAADPEHPGPDEIDLRFRRLAGPRRPNFVTVAVSYIGGVRDMGHGAGISALARSVRQTGNLQAWVDDRLALDANLRRYTMLYLVGQDAFRLPNDQMSALYDYVRQGGTVLYESCRSHYPAGEPGGDAAFLELVTGMGLRADAIPANHALLQEPHLFALPPDGFEIQAPGRFLMGEGILFSSYDYGCLWQGKRRGRPANRTELRNGLEWGENVLMYALRRQVGLKG